MAASPTQTNLPQKPLLPQQNTQQQRSVGTSIRNIAVPTKTKIISGSSKY